MIKVTEEELSEIASGRLRLRTDYLFPMGILISILLLFTIVGWAEKGDAGQPFRSLIQALLGILALLPMFVGFVIAMVVRKRAIKAKIAQLKAGQENAVAASIPDRI